MNFGMYTEFHVREGMTQENAFEESFDQVDAAEKLGMDCVWLGEHHFSPERAVLASPLIIAAAIASRTSRIRIGLAVQVLPLANPLRIAEEAATVDHVSRGRFEFGVGRSGLTRYYQGYNVPYSESRGRFLEALEVIIKAWSHDKFSYQGEFYSFEDVTVVPRPFQKPYPPTRVAVGSEETYSLIGQLGFPIFSSGAIGIPELQRRLKMYRDAWREAGHPGDADVLLRMPAYVAETVERARSHPEASTVRMVREGYRELVATAATPELAERLESLAGVSYDEILKQQVVYGTPEAVVERLQEYQETLGISGVVLDMNYGNQIPYDRVINSMRLLTEKVIPKFK